MAVQMAVNNYAPKWCSKVNKKKRGRISTTPLFAECNSCLPG